MRRLGVAHAFLHSFDLIFNMPIGDEDIRPAIIVIIEKKASEAQRDQSGPSNFGLRGLVHKKSAAFIVVERHHLVGEVADDDAGMAAAVVVGGVHAHAGARHAIFAESYTSGDSALFEGAIFFIEVEFVGLSVIGNQDVGPAVTVVIEDGDAQAFRSGIAEPGFLGDIFKFAATQVVPQ